MYAMIEVMQFIGFELRLSLVPHARMDRGDAITKGTMFVRDAALYTNLCYMGEYGIQHEYYRYHGTPSAFSQQQLREVGLSW